MNSVYMIKPCGFLGKISNVDFDINELNEPNQNIICRGPDIHKL